MVNKYINVKSIYTYNTRLTNALCRPISKVVESFNETYVSTFFWLCFHINIMLRA